jgi:hypothetical protein
MIERVIEESSVLIERAVNDPQKEKIVEEMKDLQEKFTELLNEIRDRIGKSLREVKAQIKGI